METSVWLTAGVQHPPTLSWPPSVFFSTDVSCSLWSQCYHPHLWQCETPAELVCYLLLHWLVLCPDSLTVEFNPCVAEQTPCMLLLLQREDGCCHSVRFRSNQTKLAAYLNTGSAYCKVYIFTAAVLKTWLPSRCNETSWAELLIWKQFPNSWDWSQCGFEPLMLKSSVSLWPAVINCW